MDKELIAGISLVKSSQHRKKILEVLESGVLMPSEISQLTDTRLNHVSLYLKELKNNQLVKCLNEKSKKGRLYIITDLGKIVLKVISGELEYEEVLR